MEENICFAYETKDGTVHKLNIDGVRNVLDAAFEIASSILHGDLQVDPDDIVKILDIPEE